MSICFRGPQAGNHYRAIGNFCNISEQSKIFLRAGKTVCFSYEVEID